MNADRVAETERLVTTRTYGSVTYDVQRSISKVWTDTGQVVTAINDRSLDGRQSWNETFPTLDGNGQIITHGQITHTATSVPSQGSWTTTTTQTDGSYTVQTYTDGRLTGTVNYDSTDVQLASTTITYDSLGRQETIVDARTGTTTLAYYDNDALESTTAPDPDGAGSLDTLLTQYLYDIMGRQTQVILPDASSTYTVYNTKGQVVKKYGSQQNPVEYTYDYAGRQKTMTTWQDFDEFTGTGNSGSATTTWIYHSQRGWLERKEYDDGEGTDYTYTPGGRLASRTWARGLVTNYAYNSAGDLLAVDYSDADTPDVHYTYTRTGQKDEVVDGQFATSEFTAGQFLASAPTLNTTGHTYTYAYNSRFQVETETVKDLLTNDAVITRIYEDGTETHGLAGRSKGYDLSVSSAISVVDYSYDTAGRLHTVTDGTDIFTYGYLANTRNLLETMTGPVHTTTYSYEEGRNAMTGIENKETVGTESVISDYAYTYNELGQRADREQSGDAFNYRIDDYDENGIGVTYFTSQSKDTFTYDDLGQVTASANDTETGNGYNPSYAYDEIGNRSGNIVDLNGTTGYTQDLLNQYTAVGSSSPVYDDDGNLTSDGTWTYTWNGENRLATATNNTVFLEFTYDYQGRLIRQLEKTENQTTGNWETDDEVVYLYDGWNRIAKYVDGSHSKSYVWGLDLSGSMQGAGGVGGLLKEGSLYPTYDANGNIVQKLNSSGVASMEVEYDPFGNIISGSLVGEYGFSTKPLMGSILMYYYGFRYYDPVTGRWPSRDPIGEKGGRNLYAMVRNNLLNQWDFFGLASNEIYTSLTEAINDALQDVYDATENSADDGQEKLDQFLTSGGLSDGEWVHVGPEGNWMYFDTGEEDFMEGTGPLEGHALGIEHGTLLYCTPDGFVYTQIQFGEPLRWQDIDIDFVGAGWDIDFSALPDGYEEDEVNLVAIIHSHNIRQVLNGQDPAPWGISSSDEFHADDKSATIFAIDNGTNGETVVDAYNETRGNFDWNM